MRYAIAAALLTLAGPAWGQPVCEAPSRAGSGRICATLTVENGHFALADPPVIVRGTLPSTVTDSDILASFETALRDAGLPYRAGMSKDDLEADRLDTDPARVALRAMTAPWETYLGKAADAGIDVENMLDSISSVLGRLRQTAGFVTVDDVNLLFDTESGAAQLDIVALTDTVDIKVAGVADARDRAPAIRAWLKPLFGTLWQRPSVIGRVNEYYAYLGLTPDIEADPREGRIEVVEGIRIREVNLPPLGQGEGEADARDRMKALYALLDHRDFRRWLRAMPADDSVGYVRDLGRTENDEPHFFPTRAQVQQLLLAQSGLALQPLESETRRLEGFTLQQKYIGLRVIRPNPAAANAPPPAPAGTDERGLVNPNAALGPRAQGPTVVDDPKPPDRERNNYVGGGVGYRPGEGLTLLALYQRSRLQFPLRDSSAGVRVALTGDNLISPSVNYFADYIWFERIRRRLSLQLNGSSEAVHNRILDGRSENVRRTGVFGRLEIEPFRNRGGQLLRFHLDGSRATVRRTATDGFESTDNLTTADAGLMFMQERLQSLRPWRIGVQPVLRWAPGIASEPAFVRFQTAGDAHVHLGRGFELDFSGSLHAATTDTPVFELPSIGGSESVRGFRSDAAIGRVLWSLQNELWTPVPFTGTPGDGLADFLRRVVRLAFFGDVGGLYRSAAGSETGARGGLGAGVRLSFNPVLLRFDYAYGIGASVTRERRGKFYFSVRTNLPF